MAERYGRHNMILEDEDLSAKFEYLVRLLESCADDSKGCSSCRMARECIRIWDNFCCSEMILKYRYQDVMEFLAQIREKRQKRLSSKVV